MVISNILVVEDERIVAKDIKASLESLGYYVSALAASGEEAIKKAADFCPDLVLMDIHLEGNIDGVEAAAQIYNRFHIPVIYLTAHSDRNTLQRAKEIGPFGYILKPFEERDLLTSIEMALQRFQLEKKLKESEQWWKTTFKCVGDAVIATDAHGCIKFFNPMAEALTGWQQDEAIGRDITEVFSLINTQTRLPIENPISIALQESAVVYLENDAVLVCKDKTERVITDSAAPIQDEQGKLMGVVLVFQDITERIRAAEQIKASLQTKEVLLKEIHHRVKNNLQIVSSLLNLQSITITDSKILELFKTITNRVQAMALLHELLYQSEDLAKIDGAEYIQSIAGNLISSYTIHSEAITLKIDVEPIPLSVDVALSCGLILNELVTNSLKYAFPSGQSGEIYIGLHAGNDNHVTFSINDDGVGLPLELDFQNTESLGLQLVTALTAQLSGTLVLNRTQGTEFKVIFPV